MAPTESGRNTSVSVRASHSNCAHVSGEQLPRNIPALTGIRLLAALWVVIFHYRNELERFTPFLGPLKPVINSGHFAVPLFFLLSGFILSHTYFSHYSLKNHWSFLYLRFARLWPVHVATLIALLAYTVALRITGRIVDPAAYSMVALPGEFAMVRCWFSSDLIWNYPAWSIHAEWFAYIFLFPVAIYCFRDIANAPVILASIAGLLITHHLLILAGLPGRCAEIFALFLCGAALYRLRTIVHGTRYHHLAWVAVLLVIVSFAINNSISGLVLYGAFTLLIFSLSFSRGIFTKFLSSQIVVYGGTISFSLYMTHALVHKAFGLVSKRIPSDSIFIGFATILFLFGLTILTAAACYHFVELPSNRALRAYSAERCRRRSEIRIR